MRRAIEATDAIRHRYGEGTITRARLLRADLPAPFERDPRNPLDRRARGVPTDVDDGAAVDGTRDTLAGTDVDDIPPDDA